MPDQLQLRGGTTAQHASFTGASKEVTVDTTKKTVVVHDGSTAGGNPVMREDGGNSALALGSQGTPSLKFAGDTNTGLYSPGADQLALATGGSGRLFINSSGQVGVGVSPSDALHVEGTIRTSSSTSNAQFANNFLRSNQAGTFYFDQNSGGQNFQFRVSNVTNLDTTALTITSAGRLGIGTSSPTQILQTAGNEASSTKINAVGTSYGVGSFLNAFTSAGGNDVGFAGFIASQSLHSNRLWMGVHTPSGSNQAFVGTPDSQPLTFWTAATERFRITSAGNVGIGTTSPGEILTINGSSNAASRFRLYNQSTDIGALGSHLGMVGSGLANDLMLSSAVSNNLTFGIGFTERARIDTSGRLLVGTSSTSAVCTSVFSGRSDGATSCLVRLQTSETAPNTGDNLGVLAFGTAGTTSTNNSALVYCQRDGGTWTNNSSMPSRLVFSTTADGASSPTERMRISSAGKSDSFVGSTNFNVRTSSTSASDGAFVVWNGSSNIGDGTTRFVIRADGDCENTNNSYGALSDAKLKENIVDANSQWDDLKALQVRNYNFKEGQTHTQIGLIAQEVELVSPGLVSESPDRDEEGNDLGTVTKSVNYSVLYMKAVKALQEAMERIETLEAKVAALEAS